MTELEIERRITARLLEVINPWRPIDWSNPPQERVMIFTPTDDIVARHRIVPPGLIKTVSDATHYKLLDEPV